MRRTITTEDVKRLLEQPKWTTKKISEAVGVTRQQVWKWTKDLAQPNNSSQILLAKIIKG